MSDSPPAVPGEPGAPAGAEAPPVDPERPLLALLAALCREAGQPDDPSRIKEALRGAARELGAAFDGPAWTVLTLAGDRLGLRLQRARWSPAEASRRAGARGALLAWTREGWALLVDGAGGGLHLARPAPEAGADLDRRWVPAPEVPALLGAAGPDDPVDVGIVVPKAPGEGLGGGEEPTPFRRLVGLLRPEKADLRAVVLFSTAVGLLSLAVPITVEALVNTVAFGGLLQPVIVLSLVLLGCLGLGAAMFALEAYVVELLQRRLFVRVVSELAHRLPRVHVAGLDGRHGPELVNRFFDTMTIQKAGSKLLLGGVSTLLSATVGLVLLAFYHPLLLAFDLVLLGCLVVIVFVLGRRAVGTSVSESSAKYATADWLEELARHPAAFRARPGRELARDHADTLAGTYLHRRAIHYRIVFRQIVSALVLQTVASTVLLGLGGWLVTAGQLTLGQLVAAWIIVSLVLTSVAKLGRHLESVYDVLTAVEKLGSLVDLPLERTTGEGHDRVEGPVGLRFDRVVYAYGDGPPVLCRLDLRLEPGEKLLLAGPAGAGKTTALELAFGLRAPDAGRIELDGVDLRHLRLETLRERVALARPGEHVATSILENVRLGRHAITQDAVRDLLDRLGLMDTVKGTPKGLDTRLAPDGRPLSAGHAGLLLVARALAARPQLVLIDGLLDALEPAARGRALDVLCAPDAPWTLLLVSHDAAIASRVDRRVDLDRPAREPA